MKNAYSISSKISDDLVRHSGHRALGSVLKYIEHLGKNSKVALDVGCGDGVVVRELSRRGVKAVGVDLMRGPWDGLTAIIGSAFSLPFDSNSFDAVGCFTVLEHTEEPEKLLKEMIRVLKPQGRIVIGCPNMRGVLMLKGGDFATHRGGLKQRVFNLAVYFKLLFSAIFLKKDISFEIFPLPDMTKIPKNASDYNAVCAANFIAVKETLKRFGIMVNYISSGMEYPLSPTKRRIIKIFDKIPLLREMFGGLFVTGIKK